VEFERLPISEYLMAVTPIPIERKHLGHAKRAAAELRRRGIRVDVEIDEAGLYVNLRPRQDASLDEVLRVREVFRAISYGFTAEDALELLRDGYRLEVIDLKEYFDAENHLTRVKARIIGEEGRARRTFETIAGVRMVIGDRHVAVIGPVEAVEAVRDALDKLIRGRRHETVYRYLRRRLQSQ